MDWTVEEVSPTVHRMRVTYRQAKDWTFRILVTSDEHIDHKASNHKEIKKHMQEALAGGWPTIKTGDLFCGMHF